MLRYLSAACLLLTALVSADDRCYLRTNDKVSRQPSGWFTCDDNSRQGTSSSTCCMNGDYCGPDSLCRRTVENSNPEIGKFYVGACTDRNYNDAACRQECTSSNDTNIRWSAVNSYWRCCGETGCNEISDSKEHFNGPSPAQWWNGQSQPPDGDDNDGDPFNNDDDSDGLPIAARIGIAVGLGVLFLALGIIGLVWYRARGSRARQTNNGSGMKGRYEQIPIPNRAVSPQPPPVASSSHARSQSYAGDQSYARSRSPSPMPSRGRFKEEVDDTDAGVPDPLLPGRGDAPQAPDQLSIFSRR